MLGSYSDDFSFFLKNTNEKARLTKEILNVIKKVQPESLLDIGAGNGLVSLPISQHVKKYVALEPHPTFAAHLRSKGIKVIEKNFPTEVRGAPFDAVLSCHSISFNQKKYEPFINEAMRLVKPEGSLILITFRGMKDHWARLLKFMKEDKLEKHDSDLNNILRSMHEMGKVSTKRIRTSIRTTTTTGMIRALSFVYSDGDPKKKKYFMSKAEMLTEYLQRKHRCPTGFSFIFYHVLAHAQKLKRK